jgi:hypothetical protein
MSQVLLTIKANYERSDALNHSFGDNISTYDIFEADKKVSELTYHDVDNDKNDDEEYSYQYRFDKIVFGSKASTMKAQAMIILTLANNDEIGEIFHVVIDNIPASC